MGCLAAEPVSVDNLTAESDYYMSKFVLQGALGKFSHMREVSKVDPSPASAPTHGQDVISQIRDTLY